MINFLFLFLRKFLLLIIVFFYIYSVLFSFIPFGLRTRTLYAIFGVIIILFQNVNSLKRAKCSINRGIWKLIVISLIVAFITLNSLFINGTKEVLLLYMPFSIIVVLLAAFFVISFFKMSQREVSFESLSKYIVGAVMLQMILSIVFFLNPDLMLACNNLLTFGELEKKAVEGTAGLRIQGFGTNFFETGVTNSCALLTVFMMLKYKMTKLDTWYYIVALILIVVIGVMMSRTTLVGCALGVVIWFYNSSFFRLRISFVFFRILKCLTIIFFIIFFCVWLLPNEEIDKFEVVTKFGFEMFINYVDNGKLETASSNELKEVFIFPSEFKTIIIGDGLLADPSNPDFAYYKNTDVGYSRLIYYFGVLGVLAFFIFYFQLCYQTRMKNKEKYNIFFIMLFVLILVLHFKGCANIIFYIMLFYFLNDRKTKPEIILKE